MIGDRLDIYTFEYLLQEALNSVSDVYDKRQGSIIYDALAPACLRLAAHYLELKQVYLDTFATMAEGVYLDERVQEQGITRYAATYAKRKAYFADEAEAPMTIAIGSRFSTISATAPLNYTVTAAYESGGVPVAGYYELTCETAGIAGNAYTGGLVNITFIPGLVTATMSDILTPARDIETDEELRSRYFQEIASKSFGGNISQYDSLLKDISGIGECQIYPVWNGGGTVKCSIVDASYDPVSAEFLTAVKELVDPENNEGEGLGLAPIGHKVTIVTPTEITIAIVTTITLSAGYTVEQVQTPIETAIQLYITELKTDWGKASDLNAYSTSVFISRINSAILSVTGVTNVSGTTLNAVAADLVLTEDATTQQLPKLGTVTLNV